MGLIYLSPLPWNSFAQRPHKFVEWFHGHTGRDVLWVDPYPTRFPKLSDLRRFGKNVDRQTRSYLPWLRVIRPLALPIEPLPGSGILNGFGWSRLFNEMTTFARCRETLVVFGKPSVLALEVLKRLPECRSLYDAMDDFSAFYSGFSRFAMRYREEQLGRRVATLMVSSTALKKRWSGYRADVRLVHNGLDLNILPPLREWGNRVNRNRVVLGYVGTIAAWFDWDWLIALAEARPNDEVRLIGPLFSPSPRPLPSNILILPPCEHEKALVAMRDFDVGLIPFKNNSLTESVDPIKYYEYRALGLPVISTSFGEMAFREEAKGTFISHSPSDAEGLVQQALQYQSIPEESVDFSIHNSWGARFSSAQII